MIVCLCAGVPSGAIVDLVARGARCTEDVTAACGAGADCGACLDAVTELLAAGRGAAVLGLTPA